MILFYMMAMLSSSGTSSLAAVSVVPTETRENVGLSSATSSLAAASSLTSGLATERRDVSMRRQSSQPQGGQTRDRDMERLLREVDELFVKKPTRKSTNPSQSSAKTSASRSRFSDDKFLKDIDDLLNDQLPASSVSVPLPPSSEGLQRREENDDVNRLPTAPLSPSSEELRRRELADDDRDVSSGTLASASSLQSPSASLQVNDDVINPIPIRDNRGTEQDIFESVNNLCKVDQSQIQESALDAGQRKLEEYFTKAYPWLNATLIKAERTGFVARISRSSRIDNAALANLDTDAQKGLSNRTLGAWSAYKRAALALFEANYVKSEADKKLTDIQGRPVQVVGTFSFQPKGTFGTQEEKTERIRKQEEEVILPLIRAQESAKLNFKKAEDELRKVVDIITGVHLIEFAKKKQEEATRRADQEGAAAGSPSRLTAPPVVELSPQQKLAASEAFLEERGRILETVVSPVDTSVLNPVLDEIKRMFGDRNATQEQRYASIDGAVKAVDDLVADNNARVMQLEGLIRDTKGAFSTIDGDVTLQTEIDSKRRLLLEEVEMIKTGVARDGRSYQGSLRGVNEAFDSWKGYTAPKAEPNKIPPKLTTELAEFEKLASRFIDALNAVIKAYQNGLEDLIQKARASLRPVAPEGEAAVGSGSNLSAAAKPFVPGGAAEGTPPKKEA